jgi:hypothetical protein
MKSEKTYITHKGHNRRRILGLLFCFVALRPNVSYDLLIYEVSRSHTTTHHSRQDSSRRVISSTQRLLPDITEHSQGTDIHVPGGIRNHRPAGDLRLRLRGHWDWQIYSYEREIKLYVVFSVEEIHPLEKVGLNSRECFLTFHHKFVPPCQTFNNDYYWKILQRLRENLLTQPETCHN